MINGIERLESPLIFERTSVFLRDVYDHTIQVIDIIETFRDMVSGMLDVYLSSVSNRMNEVMKVLTIIATIFIPLTFIAGVYGMNFKHMPELEWQWGYPLVMFIMAILVLFMFFLLFVMIPVVIHYSANRRFCIRSNFNQIQSSVSGFLKRHG